MIFPFDSLSGMYREFGLVGAVVIGFLFGFVLERAGFGRATKLAAQFYLYDMTVFKVMFSAIVTAMLGVVVAHGLGLADIGYVSRLVVSNTYIWPMLVGGLLLGVGFIVSGYCPGTSLAAAGSGHLDGVVAFVGVIIGSVLFGVLYPLIAIFYVSGAQGQLFLYEVLGIPPAVLAVGVVIMAVGCFKGAERVEAIFTRKLKGEEPAPVSAKPKRFAFATFAAGAVVALALLIVPAGTRAEQAEVPVRNAETLPVEQLAKRILDEPWKVRMLDLRSEADFMKQRLPGSENVSAEHLADLGLAYGTGTQDLVLVGPTKLNEVPPAALAYPGRVFVLDGGFSAWQSFALEKPTPPTAKTGEEQTAAYRFRAAVHARATGVKAAPPPKRNTKFKAPPKRTGGGCS